MTDRSTQSARDGDGRKQQIGSHAARSIAILGRRVSPRFFVVDATGALFIAPLPLLDDEIVMRSLGVVGELIARAALAADVVFEPLDRGRLLRIVPLAGGKQLYYAVFVEEVNTRNAFAAALLAFAVTPREGEVLELLLGGYSTAQMAARLFIAEGTVGDHLKSLFRKSGTGKRSDLISRVYEHENDVTRRNLEETDT
jgi:DNA-binding CsgD family transcriptional regulator